MKKTIFSLCLAISAFCLSGCSDFLDREPYGKDATWKTKEDVDQAIYALYHFVSPYWSEEICGRGHMWLECASDNILIGRARPSVDEIREFRMSPSNDNDVSRVWEVMYQNVAKANNIIKMVPDMKLDQGYKSQAVGTAYFFRGFSMLWMVPYYGDDTNGGIPIILDTTPAAEIDSPRPAHVLQNYDQIISDMRTAGEMLPYLSQLDASQIGLPHKAAAWGYAARAALYAAQYDAKYYDIVLEMCNKIMALTGSDKRELYIDPSNKLNSYANLWRKEQNHSKEYIFSLEGDYTNGARYHGVTFVNAGWGLYNTWGYFTPSKNLWDAFEEGDQRRDVTILYPGQHVKFVGRDITFGGYNTDGSVSDYTTGHVSAGLICRKFISPWEGADCKGKEVSALRDKLWNSLNCCLLRYADVMLMKAEALIWTKGEGDAEAQAAAQPDPRPRRSAAEQSGHQGPADERAPLRAGLRVPAQPPHRRSPLGHRHDDLRQAAVQRHFEEGQRPDRCRRGGSLSGPHLQSDLQQGVPHSAAGIHRHGLPEAEQGLLNHI